MEPRKVNLTEAFSRIGEQWSPKIAGEVNDTLVKLVRFQGEFVWHHHDEEDEMFLVVKGRMTMRLRTGDVELGEGEFIVIPKGVEHCPYAEKEALVMLVEPKSTLNTGNVENELTQRELGRV